MSAASDTLPYAKRARSIGERDVVVCGGGPAGCAAALAARRSGLNVLLIEQAGALGGVATSAGVCVYLGYRAADGSRWVDGIYGEVVRDLVAAGAAVEPLGAAPGRKYQPFGWFRGLDRGAFFDIPAATLLLDRKMREAGVEVLLFTQVVDAVREGRRIRHVVFHNKSGLQAVEAEAVVDATGDADIAERSGCGIIRGREEDGRMTPASLIFCVDRVDGGTLAEAIEANDEPRFRKLIGRLREEGAWPFPYDIFISLQLLDDDVFMINTTRLCGVDGTDGASLTRGMMDGRQEVETLFRVMRERFPGFGRARMRWVAPVLAIRETRRIVGEGRLTVAELVAGKTFPDTIGFSTYGWDLPDPARPSVQPMYLNGGVPERGAALHRAHEWTPIPYRIMVPQPVGNLICPGRAVSVERDVLGPLRVMAPCFAMGEAAGVACAQAIAAGAAFVDVDAHKLREELGRRGAVVDPL